MMKGLELQLTLNKDEVNTNEMVTVGQCVIDGKAEDKLLNECKSNTMESVQGMFKKQAIMNAQECKTLTATYACMTHAHVDL